MGNRQGVEGSIFSLFEGFREGRLWHEVGKVSGVSDSYRLSLRVFNKPDGLQARHLRPVFNVFQGDDFRGVGQTPETLACKKERPNGSRRRGWKPVAGRAKIVRFPSSKPRMAFRGFELRHEKASWRNRRGPGNPVSRSFRYPPERMVIS